MCILHSRNLRAFGIRTALPRHGYFVMVTRKGPSASRSPRGQVGLEDPPKHGIEDAIRAIKRAGVRPVMVTGDHPTTAPAIAERIGIADEGDENSCITGSRQQREPGRGVRVSKVL